MSAVIESTVVGARSLGYSSDEHLISRLRASDDDAFAVLVTRYERQLLSFCRRILGSREDAEDVLQDTFAAAYKAIRADDRAIDCRPWLYQIARNRCLNAIRGRRPTQPLVDDGPARELVLGPAEQVARRAELDVLVNDILALPGQQRQALVLHELEGCSYEQIAQHLGTSVSSVRSSLTRARRTLSALVEARALTCEEVRALLEDPSSPSAAARRHIELCGDCHGYSRQFRRRPAQMLRAISPFGAFFALRNLVLGRAVRQATAGGAGAAGAGSAATAGAGGAATTGAGLSAAAAKALAGLAVLAAAGTGTVVVQQVTKGSRHHVSPPAVVEAAPAASPPIAYPVTRASSPPPSSSAASKPASSTPTSTPTSTPPASAQPTTPAGPQGSQAPSGVQPSTTPATAGRSRPLPGAGMSPSRTRPVPTQAPNSQTPFPQSSSAGKTSGPPTGSGTDSGQGSQTGTAQGQSPSSGSDPGQAPSTGTGPGDSTQSPGQTGTTTSGTPPTGDGTATTTTSASTTR